MRLLVTAAFLTLLSAAAAEVVVEGPALQQAEHERAEQGGGIGTEQPGGHVCESAGTFRISEGFVNGSELEITEARFKQQGPSPATCLRIVTRIRFASRRWCRSARVAC